ncbi:hypothetical protein C9I57_10705 [Trinickia symbiotica]|uniref:Uncharacterized protein n=1 Tax=Trinickia symbiotica TaxID=863227 RepID=A0A2T3XXC0_9BURK|nr:hypothetical protein C9I57_10705 [Trinickia symbiotica]
MQGGTDQAACDTLGKMRLRLNRQQRLSPPQAHTPAARKDAWLWRLACLAVNLIGFELYAR